MCVSSMWHATSDKRRSTTEGPHMPLIHKVNPIGDRACLDKKTFRWLGDWLYFGPIRWENQKSLRRLPWRASSGDALWSCRHSKMISTATLVDRFHIKYILCTFNITDYRCDCRFLSPKAWARWIFIRNSFLSSFPPSSHSDQWSGEEWSSGVFVAVLGERSKRQLRNLDNKSEKVPVLVVVGFADRRGGDCRWWGSDWFHIVGFCRHFWIRYLRSESGMCPCSNWQVHRIEKVREVERVRDSYCSSVVTGGIVFGVWKFRWIQH